MQWKMHSFVVVARLGCWISTTVKKKNLEGVFSKYQDVSYSAKT